MKRERVILLAMVLGIFLFSAVSASFNFIGQNIKTSYLAGDTITGTINVSFDKEPASSEVSSIFGGKISLLDLLRKNNLILGIDYNCSIPNCLSGYTVKNEITTLGLDENKSAFVGFKINGKSVVIENLNLSISSDAPPACLRQVLVNTLNKNEYFIQNPKFTTTTCDVLYSGCFDNNLDPTGYQFADISSVPYCERLTLPPAAAYEFGATIKNSTTGSSDLKVKIYDPTWISISECTLPRHTKETDDLKCVINYTNIKTSDYFVCVVGTTGATSTYTIRSEQTGNRCGTDQIGSSTFGRDYEIFAREMQFDSVNLDINDRSIPFVSLVSYANDYITEKYNADCSSDCIIPFKIVGKTQNLTFSNKQLIYRAEGTRFTDNRLYLLEEDDAKITSKQLGLNMGTAGFIIPLNISGSKIIEINITNKTTSKILFSTNVSISSSFDFDLNPRFALIGIDTVFNIITTENISSSWKFGDGTTGISNTKNITHAYIKGGEYDIEAELIKSDGTRAKKLFKIIVGDPKESAMKLIERYDKRIANITNNINSLPEWIKIEVERQVDPIALNNTLSKIKSDFIIASKDVEYISIVNTLLALEVPEAISISRFGTLPISVGYNNIDTSYIEDISSQQIAEDEILKNNIVSWIDQNYETNIGFEVYSKFTDSKESPIITKFKASIKPKVSQTETTAYFLINYPADAIRFMKAYGEKPVGSGTYITLSGSAEEIEFILPALVEVVSLGAYMSPDLSRLEGAGIIELIREKTRVGLIIFWLLVLLIITLAAYIVLQEWYKKRYEAYLFKNKDDLYNLVNFIYNSRAAGLKDVEIRKKLADNKWNGEQITYAFKKIDGKRTGMYEIPVLKWIEIRKVKQEIEKRIKKPLDKRFIKKPAV